MRNIHYRRHGSMGEDGDVEQARYLRKALLQFRELARRYPPRAIFIYELFDEPYFGVSNPESHYALVRVRKGADGRWIPATPKLGFHTVRKFIMEYAPLRK